jgi:hypothetical protein
VSVESEASSLLRVIVAPPVPGESVKALIGRAARRCGLTFSRARKLWYGEARAILATEMDALRAAARVKQDEAEGGYERALRAEYREIFDRLARIEARLGEEGPDASRQSDSPLLQRAHQSR